MSSILDSVNKRTQLVGQNRLELLLFKLNGRQRFGINVFKVKEVLQCPPLTTLPKLNANVKGLHIFEVQQFQLLTSVRRLVVVP